MSPKPAHRPAEADLGKQLDTERRVLCWGKTALGVGVGGAEVGVVAWTKLHLTLGAEGKVCWLLLNSL